VRIAASVTNGCARSACGGRAALDVKRTLDRMLIDAFIANRLEIAYSPKATDPS
jgi:hypothetical protein